MDGLSLNALIIGMITTRILAPAAAEITRRTLINPSHQILNTTTPSRANTSAISPSEKSNSKTGSWSFSLRYPLIASDCSQCDALTEKDDAVSEESTDKNRNWALRVLQVTSLWNTHGGDEQLNNNNNQVSIDEEEYCDACRVDDDDDEDDKQVEFDKDSFSKLLSTVSLTEARLYAKMAYLGTLSYTIPKIKLGNLLKRHRLRYVTSSLEKKAELQRAAKAKKENALEEVQIQQGEFTNSVIDDLNLLCSSPCEWFICDDDDDDDDEGSTRYFVIQGSESIASWQANILFEPIQFEAEVDVIVHRGIYEAAKVVYEHLLPYVHQHLQRHGRRARIRLTGHSLGGSLSLLVNLMLLIRDQVPLSSNNLLPVITFGAPWVMCGGDRLLHKLGLPTNHLQGITMHRDIVPRAFSCNYPTQLADILKAINGNFRNHPCLSNQNLLYAPMGEFLILQPDAKVSPSHELLPDGCGLYVLRCESSDQGEKQKQTMAAQSVFLNTPHPLDILRDRCAYGSEGGIQRDHDVETYLISIRSVIRQQLINRVRRRTPEHVWWQLLLGANQSDVQLSLLMLYGGRECLKWLRVVVASNHMHFICFVRWLVIEACNWITRG